MGYFKGGALKPKMVYLFKCQGDEIETEQKNISQFIGNDATGKCVHVDPSDEEKVFKRLISLVRDEAKKQATSNDEDDDESKTSQYEFGERIFRINDNSISKIIKSDNVGNSKTCNTIKSITKKNEETNESSKGTSKKTAKKQSSKEKTKKEESSDDDEDDKKVTPNKSKKKAGGKPSKKKEEEKKEESENEDSDDKVSESDNESSGSEEAPKEEDSDDEKDTSSDNESEEEEPKKPVKGKAKKAPVKVAKGGKGKPKGKEKSK
jgi:hypothetical protein